MSNPRFNINIFNEELTPESVWIIGWILSDGCVCNNRLQIGLHAKDEEVLVKMQKIFNHTGILYRNSQYCGETLVPHSSLYLYNKEFVNSMEKFNIIPRKSLMLTFPNIIDQSLLRHLIRGYFEGDGSVAYNKNRNYIRINFKGTKEFLTSLKKLLKNCMGIGGGIYKSKNTLNNTYDYEITGNINSIKFLNWIYSDSEPHMRLDRKYNKAKEIYDRVLSFRKTELTYNLAI